MKNDVQNEKLIEEFSRQLICDGTYKKTKKEKMIEKIHTIIFSVFFICYFGVSIILMIHVSK